MNLTKRISILLALLSILIASAATASAQAERPKPPEASCEIVLQVLIAGGQSGDALPETLAGVAREIRSKFGSRDLRLINSYFGRSSNLGSLDYRGVSRSYTTESMPGSPTFLDWRITGLRATQNSAGQAAFQLQGLRFGARIPISVGGGPDGKPATQTTYESIGLTIDGLSVRDNVPTLIGTLSQPRTDGMLFLVLTVGNVEN